MRKLLLMTSLFITTGFVLPVVAPIAAHADSASAVAGKMQTMPDGEAVYRHVCQSCHMPDGKGALGAGAKFPALAGNPKLQSAQYPAYVVLNGFGGMPWFSGLLNDQQVANVVNYIRTHFGNHYPDTLKPEDVSEIRPHLSVEEE
ncbi:c-type cytochrome [Acetobacter orleanensis]|uniref:Cytochrome c6 n=1 Tax=Acetobacter orleanensis TaxID=104099 RepID=A0A4Y3TME4_9PROT|nr:cytochrome c [Acetobacter orleanensis]KXV64977.1 alcohol dehydrogenase [Acetobacter orleanensis]PCD78877.1 alcohol dehydrogenase [Acetobacter orleanensis]GAN69644.1 cytochrome c [Acetobacter orleanensis JCM 7639]GBR29165.1 cytochrome c precursor [Acetobacter orleanensis NRIC 0473]GEB83526.1 cytochrome c6 [Acetobacter orleanensis]